MIRIFPLEQLNSQGLTENDILEQFKPYSEKIILEELIGKYEYFKSGRDAIRVIIEHEQLNRADEVFITTTTDSSYVTSCVSATIFNYCKISRVITEKTKAIFVIHTFCFPHPDLLELRKIADDRNIPLIEDCISAFDSYNNNNILLGSVGDYAVYSLPKIIPIEYGGILTSKANEIKGLNDKYLLNKIKVWVPFLNEIKKRRRHIYFYLKERICNQIYNEDLNVNPYMYGFCLTNHLEFLSKIADIVEVGITHVEREVHIPLSPFAAIDEYLQIVNIKQNVNGAK